MNLIIHQQSCLVSGGLQIIVVYMLRQYKLTHLVSKLKEIIHFYDCALQICKARLRVCCHGKQS